MKWVRLLSGCLIFSCVLMMSQDAYCVKSKLDELLNMTVQGLEVKNSSAEDDNYKQFELNLNPQIGNETQQNPEFAWSLNESSINLAQNTNSSTPLIDENLNIQVPCMEFMGTKYDVGFSFDESNPQDNVSWSLDNIFEVAVSSKNRQENPQVETNASQTMQNSVSTFSFDMYKEVANYHKFNSDSGQESDFFFSPYSVYQSLAKVYPGVRNNTAAEFQDALQLGSVEDSMHSALNKLNLELESRGQGANDEILSPYPWIDSSKIYGFELDIDNSIWLVKGNPLFDIRRRTIDQGYLDLLAQNYGSGIHFLPFSKNEMASQVNKWARTRTNGQLDQVITTDDLDDETRMVLANLIYFKAIWEDKFDPAKTKTEEFFDLSGEAREVDMMYQNSTNITFNFYQADKYKAIELPYDHLKSLFSDLRVSMIVILPDSGKFESVESELGSLMLSTIVSQFESRNVELKLPSWETQSAIDLTGVLKQMGLKDAFVRGKADFSGMLAPETLLKVQGELCMSRFVHKTVITVDEDGTKASAFSGEIGNDVSAGGAPPTTFMANRPFIYLIWDKPTNTVLFMGRVVE